MSKLEGHYELDITPHIKIPDHLVGEVQSKMAYVDQQIYKAEVDTIGDRVRLYFNQRLDQNELVTIEAKVQRVVEKMVRGTIEPKILVLENHIDREIPNNTDPTSELYSLGEIYQEADGIYSLGPMLSRLIDFFEQQFLSLAKFFNAAPYRFPTLIPAKFLERVNYFQAFPHSLTFVTHLREDLDVIDHFAEEAACEEGSLTTDMGSFEKIQTLLSPAVCYHLYFALAGKTLSNGKLAATSVSNCFRYESINLDSLERMWNFTMREVIFVGSKDHVLENRELARQQMELFFEKIGLAYRVETANDPFFIGEFRKQAAFQSAFQLKFEIRASLPFKKSTLAIGSYNYHQDFFGRHLNINLHDGSPAHTGCVAFGLERVAFAFLAQYGLNSNNWPSLVREFVH